MLCISKGQAPCAMEIVSEGLLGFTKSKVSVPFWDLREVWELGGGKMAVEEEGEGFGEHG